VLHIPVYFDRYSNRGLVSASRLHNRIMTLEDEKDHEGAMRDANAEKNVLLQQRLQQGTNLAEFSKLY